MPGKPTSRLDRFWVVTATSAYEVYVENGKAVAEKIAVYGQTTIPLGTKFVGDVIFFTPIGLVIGAWTDNKLTFVNNTSFIVSLFLSRADALSCAGARGCETGSQNWEAETTKVLIALGKNHPLFRFQDIDLNNLFAN